MRRVLVTLRPRVQHTLTARPGNLTLQKASNKLQEIRVQEGLSLAALAKLSEVNERTIRDIENGRRPGRDVTLHRLVNAINGHSKRVSKQEYAFDEVFPSNQPLLF